MLHVPAGRAGAMEKLYLLLEQNGIFLHHILEGGTINIFCGFPVGIFDQFVILLADTDQKIWILQQKGYRGDQNANGHNETADTADDANLRLGQQLFAIAFGKQGKKDRKTTADKRQDHCHDREKGCQPEKQGGSRHGHAWIAAGIIDSVISVWIIALKIEIHRKSHFYLLIF